MDTWLSSPVAQQADITARENDTRVLVWVKGRATTFSYVLLLIVALAHQEGL
jgi:hypothetical protein